MAWNWQCPNCGRVMFVLFCMTHYKFCAMTTPPQNQPGRQNDIADEIAQREEREMMPKPWWED